jgi:hypothetical protein
MGSGAEHVSVGIVVERRAIANRWRPWRWRAVEIVPDLPGGSAWRLLMQGEGWVRYAAAGIMLELHPKQTEDYKYALSADPPQLYVVLRAAQQEPVPYQPFLVTASPWEAQAYQEPGDDLVEALPMPVALAAWIGAFVDRHDVEQPFYKRRRKGLDKLAGEGSDFVRLGAGRADDRN